jgi:hypothetical protein
MKAITHEWIEIAEGDWATANREIAVDVNTNNLQLASTASSAARNI